MRAIVERYVTQHRQQIIADFENWWDKYRVTLTEIERDRDEATRQLKDYLKGPGMPEEVSGRLRTALKPLATTAEDAAVRAPWILRE